MEDKKSDNMLWLEAAKELAYYQKRIAEDEERGNVESKFKHITAMVWVYLERNQKIQKLIKLEGEGGDRIISKGLKYLDPEEIEKSIKWLNAALDFLLDLEKEKTTEKQKNSLKKSIQGHIHFLEILKKNK